MKRALGRTMGRGALLLLALLLAGAWATAESWWVDRDQHRYHGAERCLLAGDVTQEADSYATFAAEQGVFPCPVCVQDERDYPGVEAWERGGTVVVRIPESYMEKKLSEDASPDLVPEALIHEGDSQDADLARLLHGEAYRNALSGAYPAALIPQYTGDALLMSCRHIGAAWYLVVRPEGKTRKTLSKSGELTLPMRYWRAALAVNLYEGGATVQVKDADRAEEKLKLKPEKSSGEEVWRDDAEEGDSVGLYVLRDDDVNTLVLRELHYDKVDGLARRAAFKGSRFSLNGYEDGKDAVFCCVVSDDELASLQEKWFFDLHDTAPLWRRDNGEPATEAQAAPDYAPVYRAALADGTEAQLTAAEYPVGIAAIGCTLSRPGGGVAYYGNVGRLQWLADGNWYPLGDADLYGYVNGDPENAHGGWFCDEVNLTFPLKAFGALPEGLYRLRVGDVEMNDGTAWLEFRVREGAADPGLPGKVVHAAPDFLLPVAGNPPHADVPHYNSCADVTRVHGDGWRLLVGDVVYELKGVDESWGWGIESRFSLFAYPQGQPERAALLIDLFDHSDATLYDAGDGLLLADNDCDLWLCDYDGGHLRHLGRPFAEHDRLYYGGEPAEGDGEDYDVRTLLPVGEGLYLATDGGIWYTGLDQLAPEPVYRATERIRNGDWGQMVYAEERLFVADGGIVALDTARRDGEGLMPAARLTDDYDPDNGSSGYGYIVLGGRLYRWDEDKKATVSTDLDGEDLRVVSKERFWFWSTTPSGVVLALTGTAEGLFGDERTGAAFYFPTDPENPTFDPDHCEKREIAPNDFDFILGNWLYHTDENGVETREPLPGTAAKAEVGFPSPEELMGAAKP